MGRCQGDDGFSPPSSRGQALRGQDEGMGPRIREDTGRGGKTCGWRKGDGSHTRGQDEGMGPRMREDTGWGGMTCGWGERGMGPRPPSSRGQALDARTRGGGGERHVGSPAPRLHGGRISTRGHGVGGNDMWVEKEGWVPACARTCGCPAETGDGSPHTRGHGGAGSRREDTGRGRHLTPYSAKHRIDL